MKNIVDLTDKKILVTGASSGIGRATSVLLSEIGAKVVLAGRSETRLKETLGLMENIDKHVCINSDLVQFNNIPLLVQEAVEYDGAKLDGLVHSAGIAEPIPLQTISEKAIHDVMDINFSAFLMLVKEYARRINCNGGSIVGISSINAHNPAKCMSLYAGSKMALEGAVTTLAMELAPKGIRINTVVPGDTDTPMRQAALEINPYYKLHQLLPTAKPEYIANVISFLLSDASSYVTGRHYFVDGGYF